jgi:hypothetical protein
LIRNEKTIARFGARISKGVDSKGTMSIYLSARTNIGLDETLTLPFDKHTKLTFKTQINESSGTFQLRFTSNKIDSIYIKFNTCNDF